MDKKGDNNAKEINYNLEAGRKMAAAQQGEEIVISGVSGSFPLSNNVQELKENLYNKVDMVTTCTRWETDNSIIPKRMGNMPNIDQYDPGFFGVHERQSCSMDPLLSVLQEKVVEAIFDAGLHPSDLQDTKTGVFITSSISEATTWWYFDNLSSQSYVRTGQLLAHRLSYFLKLKGPSYEVNTACSSSSFALENAYRALRVGEIDNAIVAGTNLCLNPVLVLQYATLGVLSKDGCCRCFDEKGTGYVKSEAAVALILQRAKHAKRIYAEVVHVKTNCDGFKEQGITFPSRRSQKHLMDEFYDECEVDRYSLNFLEAHITGTRAGDPEETYAIDNVFTKGREDPMLVGSLKSNMGHSEVVSGISSIVKCIFAMETGTISPNIHYNIPRVDLTGIIEGRVEVVTEKTPFKHNKGLIGVSNFGIGGANAHLLLRWNPKVKENHATFGDNLPRLICLSGRTEHAVGSLLDSVTNNKFDDEYIKLLQEGFRKNVENHIYRGYSITNHSCETVRSTKLLKHVATNPRSLYFIFGDLKNWYDIGCDFMAISEFSTYIKRIQKILDQKVNILKVLLKDSNHKNVGELLGSVVVQMALVNVINFLEIKATRSLGHSCGKFLSTYYSGLSSLEETIDYAYLIDRALCRLYMEMNPSIKKDGAEDHNYHGNSDKHVTIRDDFENYTLDWYKAILSDKDTSTIKNRIFDAVCKKSGCLKTGTNCNRTIIADLINAICGDVDHSIKEVSPDSVILQFSGDLPDEIEDYKIIPIFNRSNNLVEFLRSLGGLYEAGYNPQINKLYPAVAFPVSRGTQMISPCIKWNHRKPKFIPPFSNKGANHRNVRRIKIPIGSKEWSYMKDHIVDGRNVFPATGYLYLVWEALSMINNVDIKGTNVRFENCRFVKVTVIPKDLYLTFVISIQSFTGNFEVMHNDQIVVTGRVLLLNDDENSEEFFLESFNKRDLQIEADDFYKEMTLRGYCYRDEFRLIEKCNVSGSKGLIRWNNNWVTFIDNMLQLKIFQHDTRILYVPTFLSELTIMAKTHLKLLDTQLEGQESSLVPVTNNGVTNITRCGGIKVYGIIGTPILRRRIKNIPILQSYKFVPNHTQLEIDQSIRVNVQIILENSTGFRVKAVELVDEFTNKDIGSLMTFVKSALKDQPLVQSTLKILSTESFDGVDIEVEDKKLQSESNCLLVIVSNLLDRPDILKDASSALSENGFIIVRQSGECDMSKSVDTDFSIFTVHRTPNETLFLLRKKSKVSECKYIKISSSQDFPWLSEVQNAVVRDTNKEVVLYVENEPTSGILGLVNCLRREFQHKNIRCVFEMDVSQRPFDSEVPFYSNQLEKGMAVNVYKNKQWGTYRHLLLETTKVESEHVFANLVVTGDLSSFKWTQGPLLHQMETAPEQELIYVNVLSASGRIGVDVATKERLGQKCVLGMEFSGRDRKGNRVMGLMGDGTLSTLVLNEVYLNFKIPDSWSLEEAATVPVVYITVIYGLIERGQLRKGESILIHSGAGGVGQAAIRIALHFGCNVFTTVGTKEKREYLKNLFPELKEDNIGNSHDETFEQLVLEETSGRGVDLVLNSLAEEKLVASIRCLARGGRFIEIGKFDMSQNRHLSLMLCQKEASFEGVMADQVLHERHEMKLKVTNLLREYIQAGIVKPLERTVFERSEVEEAFKFMASGKHKGKVLIQIRKPEEEALVPCITKFSCAPRYFCDPEKVYIITGGLGGFGLELGDWLILRGARKLVLTSRKGVTTGYQKYRIQIWRRYGILLKISTSSITTQEGCKQLIQESLQLGRVDAIFHLAVVLKDAIFENQTPETFAACFEPKVYPAQYLDQLTRRICPDLSEFVMFSSITCGRGNIGQTNYAMANSVMERICVKRKRGGYPALAVEWGAVGEVGLVAELYKENLEAEINGNLRQQIFSCLQVLDTLLSSKKEAIVSSTVVAEKREKENITDDVIEAVIDILGLSNSKSVSSLSTLSELGMDSIAAIEVKQVLETHFDIFLSAKDTRTITLARLRDIQNERMTYNVEERVPFHFKFDELLGHIKNAVEESYMEMESKNSSRSKDCTILFFPGIEGLSDVYHDLTRHIRAHIIGVQYNTNSNEETVQDVARSVMPTVERYCSGNTFIMIGYSFGVLVAFEVVNILESRGHTGMLISIDGAPTVLKGMLMNLGLESERSFETALVCHTISYYLPRDKTEKCKESIVKCPSWDEKANRGIEIIKEYTIHDLDLHRRVINNMRKRCKAILAYTPSSNQRKLRTNLKLIKPTRSVAGLPEDYGLSEYFENPVGLQTLEGNHYTVLENKSLPSVINSYLDEILVGLEN